MFETFARPEPTDELRHLGDRLDRDRRELMLARQAGLTTTYNLVHDPACTDADIVDLREHPPWPSTRRPFARTAGPTSTRSTDHFDTRQGVRYTIGPAARQEILDRLLELNHERYRRRAGHDRRAGTPRRGCSTHAPRTCQPTRATDWRVPQAFTPATSYEVRDVMQDFVVRDLLGPWDGDRSEFATRRPRAVDPRDATWSACSARARSTTVERRADSVDLDLGATVSQRGRPAGDGQPADAGQALGLLDGAVVRAGRRPDAPRCTSWRWGRWSVRQRRQAE